MIYLLAMASLMFLWPVAAAADEGATLSVTNTLLAQHRVDNENGREGDDDYTAFVNRLNLQSAVKGLTAMLRADTFVFSPKPEKGFQDELRLERVSIRYQKGDWKVQGGDFYRQLGRGIALAMRKVDETAMDVSIEGGQIEYDDGEHQVAVFGGRANPVNYDAVSQKYVEETNDILAGASALTTLGPLLLGAHGLFLYPTEEILGERSKTTVAGLTLEAPGLTDWLSFYVEGDLQSREELGQSCDLLEEKCTGYAGYGSVDLTFGDLGILLEGLYLDAFEIQGSRNSALGSSFVYNLPPTLDRKDQEILNTRDVRAGRMRVEYYFFDLDLLLYANGTYRLTDPDSPKPIDDLHGFGGAELYYQDGLSRVHLSGGYRHESDENKTIKTLAHGEVDLMQALVDQVSMHLTVQHESRTLEERPYERGGVLLGVEWARRGGLTFEMGYDNQNDADDIRQLFFAGILTWDVTKEIEMSMLAGTRRGGIRCIAGVCRDYPEFAGVQGRVLARF